jgi:hypothetical protein
MYIYTYIYISQYRRDNYLLVTAMIWASRYEAGLKYMQMELW